jgi:hypothetical protein
VEVRELPETGELEVEVSRLVTLVFDEDASGSGGLLRGTLDLSVLYLTPRWPVRFGVVRRSPGSGRTKSRARMTIEDDYESEADRNVDEGYEEGDQIRDRPRHVAARHGPEEERVEAPVYETVVHRGVQPQEREQDGGHGQGAA